MKNDIEALRGFANYVIDKAKEGIAMGFLLNWVILSAKTYGIIDKNGNKSEILTGSKKKRSKPFHDKYMSLIRFAFNNWPVDYYKDFDAFRKNIIILSGYYVETWDLQGNIQLIAKSIAFDKMELEDFEKLYSRSIDVILKYVLTNYSKDDIDRCVNEILMYA